MSEKPKDPPESEEPTNTRPAPSEVEDERATEGKDAAEDADWQAEQERARAEIPNPGSAEEPLPEKQAFHAEQTDPPPGPYPDPPQGPYPDPTIKDPPEPEIVEPHREPTHPGQPDEHEHSHRGDAA